MAALQRACLDCHIKTSPEAELDLSSFADEAAALKNYRVWEKVQRVVANGEMPPKSAEQISAEDQQRLLGWIDNALDRIAHANAGDPGRVTLRRLTNTEYDNSLRDLTGMDLGLAKAFVKDNGGGEGFTNTGDVLFVSPEQLEKYLRAARDVASRASVLPGSGIQFRTEPVGLRSPASVATELNARVRSWYYDRLSPLLPEGRDDLRIEEYLLACWRHHHGQGELGELAKASGLEPAFLAHWWTLLQKDTKNLFLRRIREPWQQLPGPENEVGAKRQCATIAEEMKLWMGEHLDANKAVRTSPDDAFFLCVTDVGDGDRGDVVHWLKAEVYLGEDRKHPQPLFAYVAARITALEKQLASGEKNASALRQQLDDLRAVDKLRSQQVEGTTAPDDGFTVRAPSIVKLVLPAEVGLLRASSKLDVEHPDAKLASIQTKVFCGKSPPVLPSVLPGVKIQALDKSETWANFQRAIKAFHAVFPGSRSGRMDEAGSNLREGRAPLGVYFLTPDELAERLPAHERHIPRQIANDMRLFQLQTQNLLRADKVKQWDDLVVGHLAEFAARATRRPLTDQQTQHLQERYLRALEQTENREEAAREVIARTLFSAQFLFKTEPPRSAEAVSPLDSYELAARLSYFLWASIPDQQLTSAAADGSLLEPDVLKQQVKRMLANPKSAALGSEFFGQWLGFRDFQQFGVIDRKLFPEFDDELRIAMHDEVNRFFTELVASDAAITDILHSDYTFLNHKLARHYGVTNFQLEADEAGFVRHPIGAPRGGILGMGAILASTAFPDRASPVRRGNWIVKTVLGIETPPAPADVPELTDDGLAGKLSLRDRLEKHRGAEACRGCHSRIDPPGFALQNFDAIGRWSDVDESGRQIDAKAVLANGKEFTGSEGLKKYLADMRPLFIRQFSRKLLGYALGREVVISDRPLLAQLEKELPDSDYRFSVAVEKIVLSPQFLNRRNRD
ncbi:DUF1592 domain-containing protein [Anatilimnocola aggregata]|uniref:DUF1592 domain-containing protein n=1 Tax=Anatilimnocola aggregata TaxID=2528021 RepID=UPI00192E3965|nr:DUF1592 domain-containing protein [Anatilimnocola aggregata]